MPANYVTNLGYPLPNDQSEQDRLDLTHGMIRVILDGKLFLAPNVKQGGRILDVGTGTGIWPIEMGDKYRSAQIIGIDLSPVQPNAVPPNVKFVVDDCEETWIYPEKFNFIHCCYLAGAIRNWPALVDQMYTNTLPRGYVELQDFNFDYYSVDEKESLREWDESYLKKWDKMLCEGFVKFGTNPCPGPNLKIWMENAGFTNVIEKKFSLPIRPWALDKKLKTLGTWNRFFILESLDAAPFKIFTNVLEWSLEEVQVLLPKVRTDLKNHKIHAICDFYVVYGQKPADTAAPEASPM